MQYTVSNSKVSAHLPTGSSLHSAVVLFDLYVAANRVAMLVLMGPNFKNVVLNSTC